MIHNPECFVECKGRNEHVLEVLAEPVRVKVTVLHEGNRISTSVECPYNTGSHGYRCKASHPDHDKVGIGVRCAYTVDLPLVLDITKI